MQNSARSPQESQKRRFLGTPTRMRMVGDNATAATAAQVLGAQRTAKAGALLRSAQAAVF